MPVRHTVHCAVYALIIKDNQILLSLRKNTGWMDGMHTLPAGHLEKNASLKEALVREVRAEAGITVHETDLTLYHVMHRYDPHNQYIDFFFKVGYWTGEPRNAEPEKCEYVKWFELDVLPPNTIPHIKAAIGFYKGKLFFSATE